MDGGSPDGATLPGNGGASRGGAGGGATIPGNGGTSRGGGGGGGAASGASNHGGAPRDDGGAGGSPSTDASTPDASPIPCTSAADCPRSDTVCQKAACLGNQCGYVPDPKATPVNTPGDCREIVCSQAGTETILAAPADTDDDNECTVDSCQGNVPSHVSSLGARCSNGTGYCDAAGACVGCISDANCPAGSGDECSKSKCVQGTCRLPAAGSSCKGGVDQCDGAGTCVDCWDNRGCGPCCFCMENLCIQG